MTISTRTPEGWPGRCSVCGRPLRVEPSPATLDATCPHCGSLVWLSRPVERCFAGLVVRLLAALGLAIVVWAMLAVAVWTRLGTAEIVSIAVLAVLLFGVRLPGFCRWLVGRTR